MSRSNPRCKRVVAILAIPFAAIVGLVPSLVADEIRVPKATILTLSLNQELEAKKVKEGKEFKAQLTHPITGDAGQVVIPSGSEVKGKVEDADERHLTLKFREIRTPAGKKSIEARLVGIEAENVKLDDNELESPGKSGTKKAGSAGATAVGIAQGGMAGAAIKGIGRILFGGGGKDLKLKKGTLLRIELRKDLKFKSKEE